MLSYKGRFLGGAAFACLLTAQTPSPDELAVQSREAKQFMAAGRFEEAIPIYEKLVAAVPGNPGLLLNLGLAQEMAGRPADAIPQFQAVLHIDPENVPALTSLGTSALQTNQPKLAIPPLENLVRLTPSDNNARGMLAGAYMSRNRFSDALRQYDKLTTAAPDDPKAWYGQGKAYEALANAAFDKLTKLAPQSPYMADLLGDSRLEQRQYRSAFFFYKQTAEKLPNLPGLHSGLAAVYEGVNHPDWSAAERTAEAKLASPACAPTTAECRFLKGDLDGAIRLQGADPASLFWRTKAYNELAIRSFDRLGRIPESVEIHALEAQIAESHARHADAARQWKAALALSPGNSRLEAQLAQSLFLARNYDELQPLLKRLLTAEPRAPELNFMLGESLWRTQQAEQAVPYLEAALQADPEMLPAHAALGMSYATLNRNREAVPHLARAIGLDDDGSLHYSLARAYQASGDSASAKKAMQQYQEMKQRNQQINNELAKEAEITGPVTLQSK